jgi:hypothetical protein
MCLDMLPPDLAGEGLAVLPKGLPQHTIIAQAWPILIWYNPMLPGETALPPYPSVPSMGRAQ